MAKVTSKLQVTLPKALANQYGIEPGDEIEWQAAGDVIRVIVGKAKRGMASPSPRQRVRLFDRATERQSQRQAEPRGEVSDQTRGWTREDLYDRDRSR